MVVAGSRAFTAACAAAMSGALASAKVTLLTAAGVQPDDVPLYDDATVAPATTTGLPVNIMTESFHLAKEKLVAHFEKEYLTQLIARAGSNMSKAARLASIDRTTLYRLMEKHEFRKGDLLKIDRS